LVGRGSRTGGADSERDGMEEEEFGNPSGVGRIPDWLAPAVGHADEVAVGVEDHGTALSAPQVSGRGH